MNLVSRLMLVLGIAVAGATLVACQKNEQTEAPVAEATPAPEAAPAEAAPAPEAAPEEAAPEVAPEAGAESTTTTTESTTTTTETTAPAAE